MYHSITFTLKVSSSVIFTDTNAILLIIDNNFVVVSSLCKLRIIINIHTTKNGFYLILECHTYFSISLYKDFCNDAILLL